MYVLFLPPSPDHKWGRDVEGNGGQCGWAFTACMHAYAPNPIYAETHATPNTTDSRELVVWLRVNLNNVQWYVVVKTCVKVFQLFQCQHASSCCIQTVKDVVKVVLINPHVSFLFVFALVLLSRSKKNTVFLHGFSPCFAELCQRVT